MIVGQLVLRHDREYGLHRSDIDILSHLVWDEEHFLEGWVIAYVYFKVFAKICHRMLFFEVDVPIFELLNSSIYRIFYHLLWIKFVIK